VSSSTIAASAFLRRSSFGISDTGSGAVTASSSAGGSGTPAKTGSGNDSGAGASSETGRERSDRSQRAPAPSGFQPIVATQSATSSTSSANNAPILPSSATNGSASVRPTQPALRAGSTSVNA